MLAVAALLTIPQGSNAQSRPTASEPTASELTTQSTAPSSQVEMADAMRQNGKIYVVVAVILLVFSGFVIYAFRIDSKVSRLEKELP